MRLLLGIRARAARLGSIYSQFHVRVGAECDPFVQATLRAARGPTKPASILEAKGMPCPVVSTQHLCKFMQGPSSFLLRVPHMQTSERARLLDSTMWAVTNLSIRSQSFSWKIRQ
jgi:hypothetical protein